MAAVDPTHHTGLPEGYSLFIHPSVRTGVWHAVSPYTDLAHKARMTDEQTVDQIRTVVFDHLANQDVYPRDIATSELLHIAACALAAVERRVVREQRS